MIKLKKWKKRTRKKIEYETNECTYSFKNFQTRKTFGRDIYEDKISIEEIDEYQKDLLVKIMSFKKNTKPRSQERKQEKKLFLKTCKNFGRVEKKLLTPLNVKYF